MIALLVFIGTLGLALAIAWRTSDAAREIGGALLAGAVISGVILVYEELAEERRQKRDDAREDRFERAAEDRDVRAEERALRAEASAQRRSALQLIQEDRLAVWRQVNDVLLADVGPKVMDTDRWNRENLNVEIQRRYINDELRSIHLAVDRTLRPMMRLVGNVHLERQVDSLAELTIGLGKQATISDVRERLTDLAACHEVLEQIVITNRLADRTALEDPPAIEAP